MTKRTIVPEREGQARRLTRLTNRQVLELYADVLRELRTRGAVRSTNNPVADLAERLCAKTFGLTLVSKSTAGFDAIGPDGTRYQIKARRVTPENSSTQLSAIRELGKASFKYLLAVVFDERFRVRRAVRVHRNAVRTHARFSDHVNGHLLVIDGPVLKDKRTVDVTRQLRATRP